MEKSPFDALPEVDDSRRNCPRTVIFDEIDTGTSGEIADKMSIMQDMAHDMQVIAITHLPQIAAKGTKHYTVYKEDRDETTLTDEPVDP